MKKISAKSVVVFIKYALTLACCVFSAAALYLSPEFYKASDWHIGPCLAFLGVCAGTLIWDSVDD